MFRRIWAYIRLKRIQKALGIKKLTHEQTRAILDKKMNSLWNWERRSGKTTAAIIYTLVWHTKRLYVSPNIVFIPDPDLYRVPGSRRWVYKELMDARKKCEKAGIKVFEIAKYVDWREKDD